MNPLKPHTLSLTDWTAFSLFCFSLVLSNPLFAQTQALPSVDTPTVNTSTGNTIHFTVVESENITNDTISIIFRRTADGSSAEEVANEINTQMQSAMAIVKKYPDIIPKTSHYRINPVYNKKQVISHWRGSQSLSLMFENKPGMIQVLTLLQPYLSYQSMRFGISEDRRKEILNHLTMKAIYSFQRKARSIAQAFNAPKFHIIETRINTPNHGVHQPGFATSRMMLSESMASPSVATGESQLKVSISGVMILP